LRERELVAFARRYNGPDFAKTRRRARQREALVEEMRRRIALAVAEEEEEEEEAEEEEGEGEVGTRERDVVGSLLCPLAHYRVDDPSAAKRSLSSVTELLGLKWCVFGWVLLLCCQGKGEGVEIQQICVSVSGLFIGLFIALNRVTRAMAQALFGLTREGQSERAKANASQPRVSPVP
jgi:hypothetical protein